MEEPKKNSSPEDQTKRIDPQSLFDAARKVLLAGIGAVSLAQDEVEDFVSRLVERGEIAEKDGKKLITELRSKRRENFKTVEDELHKHLNRVLDRMNVASKSDIDDLSKKISQLSKKLDELKKT